MTGVGLHDNAFAGNELGEPPWAIAGVAEREVRACFLGTPRDRPRSHKGGGVGRKVVRRLAEPYDNGSVVRRFETDILTFASNVILDSHPPAT